MAKTKAEISRENGKRGGPVSYTEAQKALRDDAKRRGAESLPDCVQLWLDVVRGKLTTIDANGRKRLVRVTVMDRLAASRELSDRCGLPKLTQNEIIGDSIPMTNVVVLHVMKPGGGGDGGSGGTGDGSGGAGA